MPQRATADDDDEDTLELTEDMEVGGPDDEPPDGDEPGDEDAEREAEDENADNEPPPPADEGEEETLIGFEDDEGEAEADTPVIRRMRDRLKELNRENAELRRGDMQRQQEELGPKPTLADSDYDEDKYETALDEWKDRKAAIENQALAAQAQAHALELDWQRDLATYSQKREALGVRDFESAAEVVKSALTLEQQAVIVKAASDAPAFVYGLSRSDARLAELARIRDPIKLAAAIARMEGGLKVVRRRKAAAPDRPTKGSGKLPGSADKQLTALQAEADRTGDRTKLIAFKKRQKQRGK